MSAASTGNVTITGGKACHGLALHHPLRQVFRDLSRGNEKGTDS